MAADARASDARRAECNESRRPGADWRETAMLFRNANVSCQQRTRPAALPWWRGMELGPPLTRRDGTKRSGSRRWVVGGCLSPTRSPALSWGAMWLVLRIASSIGNVPQTPKSPAPELSCPPRPIRGLRLFHRNVASWRELSTADPDRWDRPVTRSSRVISASCSPESALKDPCAWAIAVPSAEGRCLESLVFLLTFLTETCHDDDAPGSCTRRGRLQVLRKAIRVRATVSLARHCRLPTAGPVYHERVFLLRQLQ
jgi:hypothetical protein